jgi:hypothetical protein
MTKETTANQLEEVAEDASKVADMAERVSDKAQAAADRVRSIPDSEDDSADSPVTHPDYLNEERGSGSTLPGADPITRPDY